MGTSLRLFFCQPDYTNQVCYIQQFKHDKWETFLVCGVSGGVPEVPSPPTIQGPSGQSILPPDPAPPASQAHTGVFSVLSPVGPRTSTQAGAHGPGICGVSSPPAGLKSYMGLPTLPGQRAPPSEDAVGSDSRDFITEKSQSAGCGLGQGPATTRRDSGPEETPAPGQALPTSHGVPGSASARTRGGDAPSGLSGFTNEPGCTDTRPVRLGTVGHGTRLHLGFAYLT